MDPFKARPHYNNIRRRQKKLRDNIMGITRPAIRRLARRGGIIRIKKEIYNEVRLSIRERLHDILKQVVLVVESSESVKRPRKAS
ncbi:hypothetical protein P170DRAFT_478132 [Aspergillus steynii IBT 23096]|uniref:Histone H4 n=1 Tax=Aspergillus steynii IBT 23096 TaxID=1392250 RepID=A0A2I2G326_9EURO|nr:uncharacterized protein P170DRAFT_478132 [Aspergillus steynii IBT 23096]PLB47278.1 hypothetical protein P170DRAFT_478132 [Aspergillus steynii IBT 23096]